MVLANGPFEALIVRGDDAQVRAFANTCRHRGAQLCSDESADGCQDSAIVCPVHGWRWQLDGRLDAIPRRAAMMRTVDHGDLVALPCAVRHGFVWVAWSDAAPDLTDFLGPADRVLGGWQLEQWAQISDTSIAVDANWKTSVDMHNEAYHLDHLHPELAPLVDPADVVFDPLGPHHRIRFSIEPAGEKTWDVTQVTIFPNVSITRHPTRAMIVRHRPQARDVGQVLFDEWSLAADAGGHPPLQRRFFNAAEALGPSGESGAMARADLLATMQLGRGVANAAGADERRLLLHNEETPIAHFHEVLDDYLYGRSR